MKNVNYSETQKEKIIRLTADTGYIPMKPDELAFLMNVPAGDMMLFREILDELETEGRLALSKKGKVFSLAKHGILPGVFTGSLKGYGFVTPESPPDADDVFIPAPAVNGALHKDRVLYKIVSESSDGRRREGEIFKVLERGLANIVGVFEKEGGKGFVFPDDRKLPARVFIPKKGWNGAENGHKVTAKIMEPETREKCAEGIITGIIGHKNDPGTDVLSIVASYGATYEFTEAVIAAASRVPEEVSAEEAAGRRDFRDEKTITIDGEDAKDLDDAVSLHPMENGGFRLCVHIADVGNYVAQGSPLDAEAYRRGTSMYLADRVIPMLPHRLSNGVCSLNAGADRLALSCIMQIDADGKVTGHEICESVISVTQRMTYEDVNVILTDAKSPLREKYAPFVAMLEDMEKLSSILKNNRIKRGAIEFDFTESKIIVDGDGKPVAIESRARNAATSLIEEFMILCNETVASEYYWREIPFIYRTHEEPEPDKMLKLAELVKRFGFRLKGRGSAPKSVQALINAVSGSQFELIINRVALRSMKQARYSAVNTGHYGLASKCYCHFTSPIRRYPDLQIHRVIKAALKNKPASGEGNTSFSEKVLEETARDSSASERLAVEIERDVEALKKIQFMADKIGMTFDGIISGVTAWGVYVELENTVEGMVSVASIPGDVYVFEEENWLVRGQKTGKAYRLGDSVKIRVVSASPELLRLDFELV